MRAFLARRALPVALCAAVLSPAIAVGPAQAGECALAGPGCFQITSANGDLLGVMDSGAHSWLGLGSDAREGTTRWGLYATSDDDTTFLIRNNATDKCVDAWGGGSGYTLGQYECDETSRTQRWYFRPAGPDGSVYLEQAGHSAPAAGDGYPGSCMSVKVEVDPYGGMYDSTYVNIPYCDDKSVNQRWKVSGDWVHGWMYQHAMTRCAKTPNACKWEGTAASPVYSAEVCLDGDAASVDYTNPGPGAGAMTTLTWGKTMTETWSHTRGWSVAIGGEAGLKAEHVSIGGSVMYQFSRSYSWGGSSGVSSGVSLLVKKGYHGWFSLAQPMRKVTGTVKFDYDRSHPWSAPVTDLPLPAKSGADGVGSHSWGVKPHTSKLPPPADCRSREIPKTGWTAWAAWAASASGYEPSKAIDDDPTTFWHTPYGPEPTDNPGPEHNFDIDLGQAYEVDTMTYLPRQDGTPTGTIEKYSLLASDDGKAWTTLIAEAEFVTGGAAKDIHFTPHKARYVRLHALSNFGDGKHTSIAEISLYGAG